MLILYFFSSILFTIYSYVLVDPNLTLINHPLWAKFRAPMVQFGYFDRIHSMQIFLCLLILLFTLQYFIVKNKQIKPLFLALVISIPLVISYPFLSHDFFNYLFDAKIVTLYHQNPYLFRALDFPDDPWIPFMHWTHRTYPYGPLFLLITLIPSFLSMGKLILAFVFFKATWIFFYITSVFLANKINREFALYFATSPIVIIEGLMNAHNDFIGVCLMILGIYLLFQNKNIKSRLVLLFSVGIKYSTLPALFLSKNNKWINSIVLLSSIGIIVYIALTREIQQWYLLNLIPFLIFFPRLQDIFSILSVGFLLSYYPYIALGENTNSDYIVIKNSIVLLTLIVTAIFALYKRRNYFLINFKSEK